MKYAPKRATVPSERPENANPNESGWNAMLFILGIGAIVLMAILVSAEYLVSN